MVREWDNIETGPAGAAKSAAAVTPNNSADLANHARAIYVGGTGHLKVDTVGGSTVTFSAVPAGTVLPVMVRRVYETGTTATLIIAIW